MRVTALSTPQELVRQLQVLNKQQTDLQRQVSSGSRLNRASEDPSSASRLWRQSSETTAEVQYARNRDTVSTRLLASSEALGSLHDYATRAREIAVRASGVATPSEIQAFRSESRALFEQALLVANSSHDGQRLFAGSATEADPFQVARNASGLPETVTYQGAASSPEVEIAQGVRVGTLNPVASNQGIGSFLQDLANLARALDAGDKTAVASLQPGLAMAEDSLVDAQGEHGAKLQRLEALEAQAKTRQVAVEEETEKLNGVDLAEVITKLEQSRSIYQAALQSGARLMDRSLIDYI